MLTWMSNATSWGSLLRRVFGAFAVLMLAPAVAVPVVLSAFVLFPIAIIVSPFLLALCFGASSEHKAALQRESWHHAHMAMPAHA